MHLLSFSIASALELRANGERGIWTLAPLLTTYSLSRGAPSASWVFLQDCLNEAERVGFEPTRPFGQTVFKTASLWPLRYLSTLSIFTNFSFAQRTMVILSEVFSLVNQKFTYFSIFCSHSVMQPEIIKNSHKLTYRTFRCISLYFPVLCHLT